jgi:phenylacetate-coenzyme A ligase PaaK-like adenylate-forming protein
MTTTDDRYWDRRLETLPPDELALVQDHRLQWQVQRCWLGSPFYRARIERAGLGQRDVRKIGRAHV